MSQDTHDATEAGRETNEQSPRLELKNLTLSELESLMSDLGEPRYRADQVAAWLYSRGATEVQQMTDLPKMLRDNLANLATICRASVVKKERSKLDATEKMLLEYSDGARIEAVVLRDGQRLTGCVSSQVGCRFGCSFCATGSMGLVRNLTAAEIVEQIIMLRNNVAPERLSNLVFMGMGEPLDNYDATLKAVRIANATWGLGIGARKITISTAGVAPAITQLAEENLQFQLAVSLNAPTQEIRASMMPIARDYPLVELVEVMRWYTEHTGRHVTLEYLLLGGVNDSQEAADALAGIAKKVPCKVNLICYNETREGTYAPPSDKTVERFMARLRTRCPTVVRRVSRGADIAAGCGQLSVRRTSP